MKTKWEILNNRLAEKKLEVKVLEREIKNLELTPCHLTCDQCGAFHETEKDFAAHYVIPDTRYLNLGWCPNGDKIPATDYLR